MTSYEKLKQVIQEANPEIMELKLGCQLEVDAELLTLPPYAESITEKCVLIHSWGGGRIGETEDYDEGHMLIYSPDWDIEETIHSPNLHDENDSGYIKVLGHPIRLVDVLLALNRGGKAMMVFPSGEFYGQAPWQGSPEWTGEDVYWNLKDDHLDNQSEETKQFLINLLVKE